LKNSGPTIVNPIPIKKTFLGPIERMTLPIIEQITYKKSPLFASKIMKKKTKKRVKLNELSFTLFN